MSTEPEPTTAPNGPVAAAILSAAIACFTLGICTLAADKSKAVNGWMNFYPPSGALTGETTVAILVWIAAWILLARLWRNQSCRMDLLNAASFLLFLLGVLLTFPPIIDAL